MSNNEISTENNFITPASFMRANELSSHTLPKLGENIRKKEKKIKELEREAKNAKNYSKELEVRKRKIVLEKRKMQVEQLRIEFEKELSRLLMRLKPNIKKEE